MAVPIASARGQTGCWTRFVAGQQDSWPGTYRPTNIRSARATISDPSHHKHLPPAQLQLLPPGFLARSLTLSLVVLLSRLPPPLRPRLQSDRPPTTAHSGVSAAAERSGKFEAPTLSPSLRVVPVCATIQGVSARAYPYPSPPLLLRTPLASLFERPALLDLVAPRQLTLNRLSLTNIRTLRTDPLPSRRPPTRRSSPHRKHVASRNLRHHLPNLSGASLRRSSPSCSSSTTWNAGSPCTRPILAGTCMSW